MVEIKICEAMRAQHIKRWAMVDVSRPQSVAEHSYNVCLIAVDYCRRLGLCRLRDEVIVASLSHDLFEVFTGDIPTPVKKVYGVDDGQFHFNGISPELYTQEVLDLVKAADTIEAAIYLKNYGRGRYASRVLGQLVEQIKSCDHAYNIFVESTAHGGRNLEEL